MTESGGGIAPPTGEPCGEAATKPPVPPPQLGLESIQQLAFLYKALDDNQSVIRFLDAKAAFAIAFLSAMTGKVLADLPFYFPLGSQPVWRKCLLFGFWGFALASAFIVFRVIFPTSNPAGNVRLMSVACKPQFFISGLQPRSWLRIWSRSPKFSRLALEQEEFIKDVKSANNEALIGSLTAEVLKVSYIRQIKNDRLRALGYFLFLSSVLFILLVTAQSLAPKIVGPQKVQIDGTVEIREKPNQQQPITPSNIGKDITRSKNNNN